MTGCTEERAVLSEEQKTVEFEVGERKIELQAISVVGDADAFGSVDGVLLVDSVVAVLDAMNRRVRLYRLDGTHITDFGRKGLGPGEFFEPAGLAASPAGDLVVLDQGNSRLSTLARQGDSLVLSHEMRLPFGASHICMIGERLYLLGLQGGHLIHELGKQGEVLRSFATPGTQEPLEGQFSAYGRVACSTSSELIALISVPLKSFALYTADGDSVFKGEVPGFVQQVYQTNGQIIRPLPNPEGFAHATAALQWLDDDRVLVQLTRVPADGEAMSLEARVYDRHVGWLTEAPRWSRVAAVAGQQVALVEVNPYPLVKVYGFR